jgi:hypothetical protein
MTQCKGLNCNAMNGQGHSPEREAQHAAAIAGGIFIPAANIKKLYATWSNTDLTEGRGNQYVISVSETKTTAERLGAKRYVQGTDCPVTEETSVRIDGGPWLVPADINAATQIDIAEEKRLQQRLAAVEKAKAAGLSDGDIAVLMLVAS